MGQQAEITELLNAANSGDATAEEAVYALVYDELKRCARRQSGPESSLSPTCLVSELYLRLSASHLERIENRKHFFALAARAMRQIVIDHARLRSRVKRGANIEHIEIGECDIADVSAQQTLELDAALSRLVDRDSDLGRIVEWHFFAGLTFQEIADVLDCHERTVRLDWELARAYLRQAMDTGPQT